MNTALRRTLLLALSGLVPLLISYFLRHQPVIMKAVQPTDEDPHSMTPYSPLRDFNLVHHRLRDPLFPSTNVHQANTSLDSCRILIDCYPGDFPPHRDLAACHEQHERDLTRFDSSAIIYKGEVVSFISLDIRVNRKNPAQVSMHLYNVCVDRRFRNRGLAKMLVEKSVESLVEYHKLTRDGRKVLLGLDVNLASEFGSQSFALYAKLGFLRGWQPCHSVMVVDWRPFFESAKLPEVANPLQSILEDPKQYQVDELYGNKPSPRLPLLYTKLDRPMDHYCMYKWYGESWSSLGQIIAAPFRTNPS